MRDEEALAAWLPVIGKALAYLCLAKACDDEPEKFDDVLKKFRFLQGIGLSLDDAAVAAGSSPASVRELLRRHRNKGRNRNGSPKRKARRR